MIKYKLNVNRLCIKSSWLAIVLILLNYTTFDLCNNNIIDLYRYVQGNIVWTAFIFTLFTCRHDTSLIIFYYICVIIVVGLWKLWLSLHIINDQDELFKIHQLAGFVAIEFLWSLVNMHLQLVSPQQTLFNQISCKLFNQ